jgi:steroid delta-isomerase-like uncharacterized protein
MSNSDVVREFEKCFEANDEDGLRRLTTDDFVDHWPTPGFGSTIDGMLGFRQAIAVGFPKLEQPLEEVIEQGDTVAARWHAAAKHEGEFLGVPATGRDVTVNGMSFYTVRDGKVAEIWNVADVAGLMEQLGASG